MIVSLITTINVFSLILTSNFILAETSPEVINGPDHGLGLMVLITDAKLLVKSLYNLKCILVTHKCVPLQTVKTQMKCRICFVDNNMCLVARKPVFIFFNHVHVYMPA